MGFIHYSEQALLDGQPPRSTLAASRRRKGCLQLVTLQFTARSSSTALSKKSDVRISKELALKRANTLVRCDSRGRAISINQWDDGTPSRFFLMRTADQAIWNFRYDVPDDIAARVERLCEQEPKGDPPSRLPAHYHRYLRLLALHASVENIRAGPVYMFTRDVLPREFLITIDQNNADLLRGGFEDWLPDVPHRQPFKTVWKMVRRFPSVPVFASPTRSTAQEWRRWRIIVAEGMQ